MKRRQQPAGRMYPPGSFAAAWRVRHGTEPPRMKDTEAAPTPEPRPKVKRIERPSAARQSDLPGVSSPRKGVK